MFGKSSNIANSDASAVNTRSKAYQNQDQASIITQEHLVGMEKRMMDRMESLFNKKFESLKTSIIEIVDKKFETIKVDFQGMVERIAELDARIGVLESLNLNDMVETSSNELDRLKRLNDILIMGVPFVKGENPTDVYKNIAGCLNIPVSPYVNAFRIHAKPTFTSKLKEPKADTPIIVKLSCQAERNTPFNAIRKRELPLKLQHLNSSFISDGKITIFESLTPIDNEIRRRANQLRRDGKLHSVLIINGAVFVKLEKNQRPIRVLNVKQLDTVTMITASNRSDIISNEDSGSSNETIVRSKK